VSGGPTRGLRSSCFNRCVVGPSLLLSERLTVLYTPSLSRQPPSRPTLAFAILNTDRQRHNAGEESKRSDTDIRIVTTMASLAQSQLAHQLSSRSRVTAAGNKRTRRFRSATRAAASPRDTSSSSAVITSDGISTLLPEL
jgi:hypothetical protein